LKGGIMDTERKIRNLESEVQELKSAVDELNKKATAHHTDIKVILNVLKEELPQAARKYGF